MRCPVLKCRLFQTRLLAARPLLLLLLLLFPLLLLTVLSLGTIEEWLLSPRPGRPSDPEVWRARSAADSFDPGLLEAQASGLYRQANPGACAGGPVFLLAFVVSKPAHLQQRQAIRSTWGSVGLQQGLRVRTLFALGLPASVEEARLVQREAQKHGDLVQGRFADTYLNLTLKTLMVLRWAATYCPSASFLLKVDDDVFVNPRALVQHLSGLGPASRNLYLGRVHSNVPVDRDSSSLYYVPEAAFAGLTYPRYCSGTAYVLSGDAARKVYVAALSRPLLAVEDVFVGVCAGGVGILPTPCSRMSGSHRVYFHRCCYKHIFTSHRVAPGELRALWALVDDGTDCWLLHKYTALLLCNSLNLLHQARYLWPHTA